MFDTSVKAGVGPQGKPYTFDEEYEWLGFTARDRIFEILDEVIAKRRCGSTCLPTTSTSPTSPGS